MERKPLIGITCSFKDKDENRVHMTPLPFDMLKQHYSRAVWKAGGLPVILPNLAEESFANEIAERVDGVVFSGGEDVEPKRFGEEIVPDKEVTISLGRDRFEFNFFEKVYRRRIPILGICRGHQFINVALKGGLFQDLSLVPEGTVAHESDWKYGKNHKVEISEGSMLASILKTKEVQCNTNHHQVVDRERIGKGLKVVGICPDDKIVEACEAEDGGPLITVQWHPEMMLEKPAGGALFAWMVAEAAKRKV